MSRNGHFGNLERNEPGGTCPNIEFADMNDQGAMLEFLAKTLGTGRSRI